MPWEPDVLDCLSFSLIIHDIGARRTYADSPSQFRTSNGLLRRSREEAISLTTYQLMAENGYLREAAPNRSFIGYERSYHANIVPGQNHPRSDLLVKDFGVGQSYNYVEVKSFSEWNTVRNNQLRADTQKLHRHGGNRGKFCLLYRIITGNQANLWDLAIVNRNELVEVGRREFPISLTPEEDWTAQIALYRCLRPM